MKIKKKNPPTLIKILILILKCKTNFYTSVNLILMLETWEKLPDQFLLTFALFQEIDQTPALQIKEFINL